MLFVAGVIVLAAIVVVLLHATSSPTSNSNSSSSSSSAARTGGHKRGHGAAISLKPAEVSLVVLNGTNTTGLAHDISVRLGAVGYKVGNPATASNQTLTSTIVGYRARSDRAAALLVARSLGLKSGSVQPVDQANEAVACPQAATCPAQVIVTVGADLASTAGTATTAASST